MNDGELDLLVASVSPINERQVAQLPLSGLEDDLRDAITSTPRVTSRPVPVRLRRRPPQRFLAAAAAVLVLLVGLVGLQLTSRDRGTAWAAEVLAVAESAPRLLVDAPGWSVTRADQFSVTDGEMTFGDGARELELRWTPADQGAARAQDRARSSDLRAHARVTGRDAVVFRYEGASDFVALWTHGEHLVEARGVFTTVDDLRRVLGTVVEVDVDTWLGALPASVVKPQARAAEVDAMLADIPLPEGFDRDAVRDGGAVRERYQLGARVAGSAACAWIERWIAATDAAAQRAVQAMATSRSWDVLVEMQDEGAYPEVVWELADAMRSGAELQGGRSMTIRESYASALGCGDR